MVAGTESWWRGDAELKEGDDGVEQSGGDGSDLKSYLYRGAAKFRADNFVALQDRVSPHHSSVSNHTTTMETAERDPMVDLEQHRLRLEETVAKLRKSLQHWQTWEFEYEALKEEIQRFKDQLSTEDMVQHASFSPTHNNS
jgi:hypothetical protein